MSSEAFVEAEKAAATVVGGNESEGNHYNDTSVATSYESAFFYDNLNYREWLLSKLIPLIESSRPSSISAQHEDGNCRIADIGGGTGNFTAAIAKKISRNCTECILCVDPYEEMLKLAHAHHPFVKPVLTDAVSFSQSTQTLHFVLLKEVIHHIAEKDWNLLFSGFFKQLLRGGKLVIITRPQEVEYPMFPRAHEIWKEHQPPSDPFCEALRRQGFEVDVNMESYNVALDKEVWLEMVSNRFWSTFSHCSDLELQDGLKYMRNKFEGQNTLEFNDNLVFIVATKP